MNWESKYIFSLRKNADLHTSTVESENEDV